MQRKKKKCYFFLNGRKNSQCSLQIVQDLLIFIRNVPNVPNIS